MILEYMLIREAGAKRTPSWVEDGGYFQNPDDFTLIGVSPDAGDRDYYIPDTVVVLTRETLIARQLAIHAKYPARDEEGNDLTDAQVEEMVVAWCDAKGQ